jgi:hypothetical protein
MIRPILLTSIGFDAYTSTDIVPPSLLWHVDNLRWRFLIELISHVTETDIMISAALTQRG